MGFVDHEDVGLVRDSSEPFRKVARPGEVGVVEHREARKVRGVDVRQVGSQFLVPDGLPGCLRGEENHALVLLEDESFDQHETDVRLAQADPVAKERSAESSTDVEQRPVGVVLVAVQFREHLRGVLFPDGCGLVMPFEEFPQCSGVDVEGGECLVVPLHDLEYRVGDVGGVVPVLLVPALELGHLRTAFELDVEFDVLGEAWPREIG